MKLALAGAGFSITWNDENEYKQGKKASKVGGICIKVVHGLHKISYVQYAFNKNLNLDFSNKGVPPQPTPYS